jgi:putative colanic acid biosynthesis UDP-glucose lipid carrier transferase
MSHIHPKMLIHSRSEYLHSFSGKNQFVVQKKGYLFFKRAADIFFSIIVMLLVFPWLFPVLTILIKLNSKGPVFFKQERMGYCNKTFLCIKFRTMFLNDFSHTQQAEQNDPRITKIGKFLRESGLDELPQFINILSGDMSIIGPRPFMLSDYEKFLSVIPGYAFRNSVRPGITGLAQVKGFRGKTDTTKQITGRFFWDSYYVKHISFFTDFSIVFQTLWLTIKPQRNKEIKNIPVNQNVTIKKIEDHPAQTSLSKLRY